MSQVDSAVPRTPYVRRVLIALGLATVIVVLLYFFWQVSQALLVLFASCLFAIFLSGCSRWLSHKTGLRYGWCLLIVVLLLLVAFAAAAALLAAQLVQQADELYQGLSDAMQQAREWATQFGWGQQFFEQAQQDNGLQLKELAPAMQILTSAVGGAGMVIIILVIGLYLAGSPELYLKGMLKLAPIDKRDRAREVLVAIGRALQGWLLAQFISMTVIGSLVAVGLLLFGIELWLILGLLVGMLSFIPNLGPMTAAVPTLLIALNKSPAIAGGVLAYLLTVEMIEGYLVTPMVQDKMIRLPPAAILWSQVLMGYSFGILGVALAAPLLTAIMVAVEMLYVQDVLGDRNIKVTGQ